MDKPTFHDLVVRLKELARERGKTPSMIEFITSGVSRRQIDKYKYSKIVDAAGLEANPSSRNSEPAKVIIRPPKILILDIETSSILAHVWGLYDQNVSLNQIEQDWYILSFAAKWYKGEEIFYWDQRKARPKNDDKKILTAIHKLLDEADYAAGHNLARFDLKKLNARFILHGLPPVKPFEIIDTLRIAKKHFAFTSNKLEHLARYLKCELEKSEHAEFSGMKLWTETMSGNVKAFDAMKEYNIMDVKVTEMVLEKLLPWEPSIKFQSNYWEAVCSCGCKEFKKNGYKFNRSGAFQMYRCVECSKCFIDKSNLVDKDARKSFFK
ncbi:MAG: ribonuclease H-like domain-containing protein [Dolichospermum sp.]|nr:ribonuclease H-like domain-containing protein [Dolichospermum sp.]